jgi:hypothetical protein
MFSSKSGFSIAICDATSLEGGLGLSSGLMLPAPLSWTAPEAENRWLIRFPKEGKEDLRDALFAALSVRGLLGQGVPRELVTVRSPIVIVATVAGVRRDFAGLGLLPTT